MDGWMDGWIDAYRANISRAFRTRKDVLYVEPRESSSASSNPDNIIVLLVTTEINHRAFLYTV